MALSNKPSSLIVNVASSVIVDYSKPNTHANAMCGGYSGVQCGGFVFAVDRDHVTLCKYVRVDLCMRAHACASVA